MGFGSGHDAWITVAVHEVALRQRNPSLVAIGDAGIAVSLCSLSEAVHTLDRVMHDLGRHPSDRAKVHRIPRYLQSLALAVVRGTGITLAWDVLGDRTRSALMHAREDPHAFFTRARLVGCSSS